MLDRTLISRPTIGIDVGGTFTDFVAMLPDGRMVMHKQPSTPEDPSLAVQQGLAAMTEREPLLGAGATRIVHGTTIALNAVLQRKVADIALIVTSGNRDVLEIARIKLETPFNLRLSKERPIVPRHNVFEVAGRVAADGEVMWRPNEEQLQSVCAQLRASGVNAVAIMLLNSYIEPAVERDIAAYISRHFPQMLVTCSADIWPEVREYERAVVACLNAQVHPLMEGYLTRLDKRVRDARLPGAVIQITSSAGGTLSIQTAQARPIDTMLSGPASGATAAARMCHSASIPAAISFDMGGTSADIAVIQNGEVEFTTKSRIGDLPLMMPVVGVSSIGAGGGSIVSVDAYGLLKVGPESAGAHPGPVAYGLGGTRPTVTDCYLALGIIDPNNFLGGAMKLDRDKSMAALGELAGKVGLRSAEEVAQAALKVATARMASELFKLLAQKGHEPRKHFLLPFGGAGPTHSVMLAAEAELAGIVVPPAAATFCAFGAAMADVRREYVRGLGHAQVFGLGDRLWKNWEALEREAADWLAAEGIEILGQRFVHAVDMRYAGQSFSITTPIAEEARTQRRIQGVIEAFHRAHEDVYGFRETDEAVEAVSQRLSIIGEVPKAELPVLAKGGQPSPRSTRKIFHDGAWMSASIYRREDFGAGSSAQGPAVIEQDDTCLWVPPGWSLTANSFGMLMVTRGNNAN